MSDETPALTLTGRVAGVYVVESDAVESTPRSELQLTYAGVVGDRHEGLVRPSGARAVVPARHEDAERTAGLDPVRGRTG